MDKQLKEICIILGLLYYSSCFIYLQHIGMSPITIGFAWLLPLLVSFMFLLGNGGIKTNLFSEIKRDYKSPVYKLETNNWGENVVSKYIVNYDYWDDGWAVFFPFIWWFSFRQHSFEGSFEIGDKTYNKILEGVVSTEVVYLRKKIVAEKKYYNRISAEKIEKEKLREVNKEYYNNFKTK